VRGLQRESKGWRLKISRCVGLGIEEGEGKKK
jgi:hypothetical protein